MKKSKILVPAIALLALGVAGSTVGTVAWFTVDSASKTPVADTGSVSARTSSDSAGAFTITAVVGTITNQDKVVLTDDVGDTYVMSGPVGGPYTKVKVPVPTGASRYASADIQLSITYAGDATDATAVSNAWKDTVGSAEASVAITDTSGYSDGKGLKFWEAGAEPTNWAGSAVTLVTSGIKNVTFSDVAGTFTATIDCTKDLLIGIKGVNDLVQTEDDAYEFTATPAI